MNTDEPIAESSPAPMTVETMTPEQRGTWRKTGEVPESNPAASTPAEPDAQVASTEALAPASEPADAKSKGKKNAETRIQELLAERAALKLRLEEIERSHAKPADEKPAGSSPAPPSALTVDLSKPPLTEGEYFDAHPDVPYAEYARYLGRYDRALERQAEQQVQQVRSIESTLESVERKAVETYPDFDEKAAAVLAAGVQFSPAINEVLLNHPQAEHIAYALVSDAHRLAQFNRMSPVQVGFALASLLPQAAHTPAPVLTKAPAPPPSIGSKPATPVDDVEAAIKRGDFASYREAMNRRKVGAR